MNFEAKEGNIGEGNKIAKVRLLIPTGFDPFAKQKTKTKPNEVLVSTSALEGEEDVDSYELFSEKNVNDQKCTNQFTSVSGLKKFLSENPDKYWDT